MVKEATLVRRGQIFVAASIGFFLVCTTALFADFLSSLLDCELLRILAADHHYKYFFLLLVPTAAYFVIANWVGWQYYRNA